MRRWAGLGVMADDFIQMGGYLARQNTNWLSPLASRTRMDTRKIATEDYIRSVQCYLAYVRKCIFATESS
jgi:hypothetical protein